MNHEVTRSGLYSVELDANPSTGYMWQVEPPPGVIVVNSSYKPGSRESRAAGKNGTMRYLFKLPEPGMYKIRFVHRRPWIDDDATQKTHEVNVIYEKTGVR